MTDEDVFWILDLFKSAGVRVRVDGGWGVDALLREQTRPHYDLDIVIRHTDLAACEQVMERACFRILGFDGPHNFVLIDDERHEVDVHLIDLTSSRIDGQGIEVYGPNGLPYKVGSLEGTGMILDRQVGCLAAEFRYGWYSGFELTKAQIRDVIAMHERFGSPLPWDGRDEPEGRDWRDDTS